MRPKSRFPLFSRPFAGVKCLAGRGLGSFAAKRRKCNWPQFPVNFFAANGAAWIGWRAFIMMNACAALGIAGEHMRLLVRKNRDPGAASGLSRAN